MIFNRQPFGLKPHAEIIAEHVHGCTGKQAFLTQPQAARRAKLMRRRCDERLVEYHCKHCKKWHIGGQE